MTSRTKFHEDVSLGTLATAGLLLVVVFEVGDIAEATHGTRAVDHIAICTVW